MMADHDDIPDLEQAGSQGFVAVVVARSAKHAEMFRVLLEDHDIPSILGTEDDIGNSNDADPSQEESALTLGVSVLVPEGLLDEAGEIIADREDFEEFDADNDLDEEDEQLSLDDGMTEETGPAVADAEFLDDDEDSDDLADSDNNENN